MQAFKPFCFTEVELAQNVHRNLKSAPINRAMSNPNDSLSQKVCHYLNQDRTLNDILMRAVR